MIGREAAPGPLKSEPEELCGDLDGWERRASRIGEVIENYTISDPALAQEVELVHGAYPGFDMESYRAGHLTPVYFGSAYNNFGVRELLNALAAWAPPPRPQPAEPRPIEPTERSCSCGARTSRSAS
jgi:peptide subunit release factor RF-3